MFLKQTNMFYFIFIVFKITAFLFENKAKFALEMHLRFLSEIANTSFFSNINF